MKKTTEVLGHPLWMLPTLLVSLLVMIESLHTLAHLRMEMDVHGYCMQNKEYLERKDDDW